MKGLWAEEGVPHHGWTCVDVQDLGPDEDGWMTCEMCLDQRIRYAHFMEHPDHHPLQVGCVCAEAMAEGYQGAEHERHLRNRAARRAKWIKRSWRVLPDGGMVLRCLGYRFYIAPVPGGWRAVINLPDRTTQHGRRIHSDLGALKLILFDHIWPRHIGPRP